MILQSTSHSKLSLHVLHRNKNGQKATGALSRSLEWEAQRKAGNPDNIDSEMTTYKKGRFHNGQENSAKH